VLIVSGPQEDSRSTTPESRLKTVHVNFVAKTFLCASAARGTWGTGALRSGRTIAMWPPRITAPTGGIASRKCREVLL
jgi:hypothetical protein